MRTIVLAIALDWLSSVSRPSRRIFAQRRGWALPKLSPSAMLRAGLHDGGSAHGDLGRLAPGRKFDFGAAGSSENFAWVCSACRGDPSAEPVDGSKG
jgi:hypothetical protein